MVQINSLCDATDGQTPQQKYTAAQEMISAERKASRERLQDVSWAARKQSSSGIWLAKLTTVNEQKHGLIQRNRWQERDGPKTE